MTSYGRQDAHLLRAIVEVVSDRFDDFAESALVLGIDGGQAHGGAGLTANHATQTGFALHDAVRHVHFSTNMNARA